MHIKIDIKIFAFTLLFIITSQIQIYVLLMIFAMLHEIGHLLAGLFLKLKPKNIELNPFGLAITFEGIGNKFTKNIIKKRILIALAGPLVNFLFIILAIILPEGELKLNIIYTNVVLMLVNLFPIYPLDGGRILKNLLHMRYGYFISCKIINKVSNIMIIGLIILSSILIFYFKNIAILFIIFYLIILTIQENYRFKIIEKAYEQINMQNNNIVLEKLPL